MAYHHVERTGHTRVVEGALYSLWSSGSRTLYRLRCIGTATRTCVLVPLYGGDTLYLSESDLSWWHVVYE